MKIALSNLKKKFVLYLNRQAFTLLEMLFAFSIFSMIILFVTPVFQLMLNERYSSERLQGMEWDVFCSQIKKEVRMSQQTEIVSNKLFLTTEVGTVNYEKYGNVLRRRVNFSGHETLLQNISEVTFTIINNAVSITVKSLSGKSYKITIYPFIVGKGST